MAVQAVEAPTRGDPIAWVASPGRGAAVAAQGLRKRYGANQVLRGIDLQVDAGQFVAVVGRSGSGKSTLLRLLAGLEQPTSGGIALGDSATRDGGAARVMFQEPRLLPWATVLANVRVGLGPGAAGGDGTRRALEALRCVGLEERAGDWPSVLSGGQKQRVALARALVSQPRFLALDEPLGALDALTRIEMQDLLASVWQDEGFTAVLVTHDVVEALILADRVVLIEDGAVALDLAISLPRPRRRSSAELTMLEERILGMLLADRQEVPSRPAEPEGARS